MIYAMTITLQLYATLGDYLPPGSVRNTTTVETDTSLSIPEVLGKHKVPDKSAHLVLVNGTYIHPTQRAQYRLKQGDVLAVWPPIAGG